MKYIVSEISKASQVYVLVGISLKKIVGLMAIAIMCFIEITLKCLHNIGS